MRSIRMNRRSVMMIPLYVLAFGALVAGLVFKHYFIGEGAAELLEVVALLRSGEPYSRGDGACAARSSVSGPTLMMVGGFFVALYVYILAPGTAQKWADAHAGALSLPAQQMVLRRAL